MGVRDPRVGHKSHVEWVTLQSGDSVATVKQGSHFDGSQDATVKVKSLRLNITAQAPPDPALVRAVAELEEAQRQWTLMKHSPDEIAKMRARSRLVAANERIVEIQNG